MDKTWTFQVDGPLVGFLVHAKPWTDRAKRYAAFKSKVRLFANLAGVPTEIPENHRATVSISVAWERKARVDLSNILKAIEDGLWAKDRGIGEVHGVKFMHTGLERVSVTIGMRGETDGKSDKHKRNKV